MRTALLLTVLLAGAGAGAGEYRLPPETAVLRPSASPGYEVAVNNCTACHSADYLATQPPGKPKIFWEAIVAKMIFVFKAPIADADAKLISAYLAESY